MKIFLIIFGCVIIYLLLIGMSIFCIYKIKQLILTIQRHKKIADNLEEKLYKDLRIAQYRAMNISKQAKVYAKNKNSILLEAISTATLALLPFKKLKSLLFLQKLSKKCFFNK